MTASTCPDRIIVAGLDLSLTGTGVCAYDGQQHQFRTISTKPRDFKNIYDRLDHIVDQAVGLLPDSTAAVCVEAPFVRVMRGGIDSSSKNLIALSHMVRRGLVRRGIPFHDVAATQLKKYILGKGKGEKSLILREVFKRYGVEVQDDNQADACVLAHIAMGIAEQGKGMAAKARPAYQMEVIGKIA